MLRVLDRSLFRKIPNSRRVRIVTHVVLARRLLHTPAQSGLPPPRLDYRNLNANIDAKVRNALLRKSSISEHALRSIPSLYTELKTISTKLSHKRHIRSETGDRIREASKNKNLQSKEVALTEAASLKQEITHLEERQAQVEQMLHTTALAIPNDSHPSSPIGPESSAKIITQKGPTPLPADTARDHVSIAKHLDLLDLENAAIVSGTSWYYLRNEAALLELALSNYALSIAVRHGYTPVTTPDVVRYDIAPRCGFQPREGPDSPMSQIYYVHTHLEESTPGLILAATSEIPIAGMFANKLLLPASLPVKVAGTGHAFRSEAGARGADTRGLYRVHQFTKVELFVVTAPEDSEVQMASMLEIQEEIVGGLDIPYRVLDMPTEELGSSAYRKYDIEAWMPGRGSWGEISSLSNCTDYQSRRMHIRLDKHVQKFEEGPATMLPFAHTLNGTAAAIPRLIVALLENGAIFDENEVVIGVVLPKALKPFWFAPNSRNIIHWR